MLYTSRYCGFCYRVLATIKRLGLTAEQIEVVDVTRNPHRRQDIVRATGRRTVPVLRIAAASERYRAPANDGAYWLFESRDITRYLHSHFDRAE